jgi:hypothetical protein
VSVLGRYGGLEREGVGGLVDSVEAELSNWMRTLDRRSASACLVLRRAATRLILRHGILAPAGPGFLSVTVPSLAPGFLADPLSRSATAHQPLGAPVTNEPPLSQSRRR